MRTVLRWTATLLFAMAVFDMLLAIRYREAAFAWLGYGMALFGPAAAAFWWSEYARRRRLKRAAAGCCGACGYDRNGLVGADDAKCPECGAVPAPASK